MIPKEYVHAIFFLLVSELLNFEDHIKGFHNKTLDPIYLNATKNMTCHSIFLLNISVNFDKRSFQQTTILLSVSYYLLLFSLHILRVQKQIQNQQISNRSFFPTFPYLGQRIGKKHQFRNKWQLSRRTVPVSRHINQLLAAKQFR